MRYFIRIAFLGNGFYGTQKQKNHRTVQGDFEEKLSQIFDENIKVIISSRLDRNVNALDFALAFDTEKDTVSPDHLKYYLRRSFLDEVYIKDVRIVPSSFSPRYDCENKTYCYLIQNTEKRNPLLSFVSYTPIRLLDIKKVEEVLSLLEGEHDFSQFATPEGDENTFLTLDKASVKDVNGMLQIRFTSKAFLRYQVRFMVGAIFSYCDNKLTLFQIRRLLNGEDIKRQKLKAEAKGLYLEHISYPEIEEKEITEISGVLFTL